mmetsp:Transcript_50817/g.124835  ORF Transcript_50817/g.124835 Transcript_50817/m.124835 type:complete len:90 (-) Transcript_50817:442-711(-)
MFGTTPFCLFKSPELRNARLFLPQIDRGSQTHSSKFGKIQRITKLLDESNEVGYKACNFVPCRTDVVTVNGQQPDQVIVASFCLKLGGN